MTKQFNTSSLEETIALGKRIGKKLRGGEVVELISDLGGGKTQLVRGLAEGMGSHDVVQSPSFTISRIYRDGQLELYHYDFHRLQNPGILVHDLEETLSRPRAVVALEWANQMHDILPADRLIIKITTTGETDREISLEATGPHHDHLLEEL